MAAHSARQHRPRDEVYYRKLVDGGMVYDGATDRVHHLNLTAARIWEACQVGQTSEQIISGLVLDFSLDRASAEADVQATMSEFDRSGLFFP